MTDRTENPHTRLAMTAADRGRKRKGIANVMAKRNFDMNVAMVALQISLAVCAFSDSSEMWIPRASENASAIAIVRMPPNTATFE